MAVECCKIHLLMTAALMTVFLRTAAASTNRISAKKPHVIFIVADDLGWNDVSWNNPSVLMPHMDDLATNGVILNQSYVQPKCTPSRASLMTGKYPFTMGLQEDVIRAADPRGLPLRFKTLPRFLKNLGYTTHAIGKWHLGFCSWDYTPTRRGFDSFYGFYTGAQDYYSHKKRTYVDPHLGRKSKRRKGYIDLRNNTKADRSKKGVYSTHLFASAAEDIIRSRDPKDPMFLYLAFQSVHSPLQVPHNYTKVHQHVRSYDRRVYLGMVTAMDEAIGRVVAALKATGHYDNSVIIFTTDNGGSIKHGASNWPLRGGKSTIWEGGTRGPAFIHSPHLPNPGTVSDQLIHITDWFTTILSIAGTSSSSIPSSIDGVNQWDAIAGASDPPREWMVYNIDNTRYFNAAVRFKNHKMLVGTMALINWSSSSREKNNERDSSASENTDYIIWKNVKNYQQLDWDRQVLRMLGEYMKHNTKIRLYNLENDPEEKRNISWRKIFKLQTMLNFMSRQLYHYKPVARRKDSPWSHPTYWKNTWSPGWCDSEW